MSAIPLIEVTVHRAGSIGEEEVPTLNLLVRPVISESFTDLNAAMDFYRAEGKTIADALWKSLPGGTLDGLLLALLERRASLFRVRF